MEEESRSGRGRRRRWRRTREEGGDGGRGRSELGFGLRVGGISFFSSFFCFSVDRWIDGSGMERWMVGWMGAISSIRWNSSDWLGESVI